MREEVVIVLHERTACSKIIGLLKQQSQSQKTKQKEKLMFWHSGIYYKIYTQKDK